MEFGGGGGGGGGIWFLLECLRLSLSITTSSSKLMNGVGCIGLVLGPGPTGTGTIALDPTLGSFTLLEPISH